MRIRLEGVPHWYHEDHIAAKGMSSLRHYNLVHKFMPMPQALKKTGCKKKRKILEKILAWQLAKVRNKREVIEEARNKGSKVHFASLMTSAILRIERASTSKVQRQGRTPR